MRTTYAAVFEAALVSGMIAVTGCGPQSGGPLPDSGRAGDAGCPGPADAGCPGPADAGPATPLPSDPAMYAAWLGTNSYRTWRCDARPQPPLADSPHGNNVICVNPTLEMARSGTGQWPVGSAVVKVAYDAAGAEVARFLDVRRSDAPGAAGWYFLRRTAAGAAGPAGLGSDPTVAMACVGCHAIATRDFVRRTP
jgi:hypothetical protein